MNTVFDAPLFRAGETGALLVVSVPGDRFDPEFLVAACLVAREVTGGAPTQVVVAAGGPAGYAYVPLAAYLGAQLFTCADAADAVAALGVVVEFSTALAPHLSVLAASPTGARSFAAGLEASCPGTRVSVLRPDGRVVCPQGLAELEDAWWDEHGPVVVGSRWRSHRNRSRRRLAAAWAGTVAAAAA